MRSIVIETYNPKWAEWFEVIKRYVGPSLIDIASSIEHVGSTSVPGLSGKPIIDMSVVVESKQRVTVAIERLAHLGYMHRGQMGVEGREAFDSPADCPPDFPAHHLYVCLNGSVGLSNHLIIRDYLLTHPESVQEYGQLKHMLAEQFANDIDGYIDGKTDFLVGILQKSGMSKSELDSVEKSNRIR